MNSENFQQEIYSKIEELPTLPIVSQKILEIIDNVKTNVSDLTEVIYSDPSLTAKILKVANSAYYGFPQEITTLERAVPLLGFSAVKSLALSLSVLKILPSSKKHDSKFFNPEGLWHHSLGVALCMKEIASFSKRKRDDSEYLFIVGLLHDVGKIVLDQFFHDDFCAVLEKANANKNKKLHDIELEIIGVDHCDITAMLLTRWKFPEIIIDPIKMLHQKEFSEDVNKKDVASLRIANSLSRQAQIGLEGNLEPNEIYPEDLDELNISENDLNKLKTNLEKTTDKIVAFFE